MIVIGIDPGLDGALAILALDDAYSVFDTPTLTVVRGKAKRREYDLPTMISFIAPFLGAHRIPASTGSLRAAIESVHAMPGQGVRSMFSMGKGLGLWMGIVAAFGIPYDLIPPQRWKKVMLDGMGKEKDASRLRAQQLFPSVDLSLKKHHGRADALLIAEYVRRGLMRNVLG